MKQRLPRIRSQNRFLTVHQKMPKLPALWPNKEGFYFEPCAHISTKHCQDAGEYHRAFPLHILIERLLKPRITVNNQQLGRPAL